MEKSAIEINGTNLSYLRAGNGEQSILLVHGNSSSSDVFKHQLQGDLVKTYDVIALDLPGHGASDALDGPENYSIPAYATYVSEFAKALGLIEPVVVGWSLGGHIALEMHNMAIGAKGFMIYGTPPLAFPPDMENAFLPNPAMASAFAPEIDQAAATAFANAFFAPGVTASNSPFISDILATDGNARAGMAASIAPGGYQDEVEIVANLSVPLAIVHGEQEQLVNGQFYDTLTMPTLWRQSVQVIGDAGHAPHWEQPAAFDQLVSAFAEDLA